MKIAFRCCESSPADFMRLRVSRQEMPASTRMLPQELETTVQLPRLPLAKTVMRTAIAVQHSGNLAKDGSSKIVNRMFGRAREHFQLFYKIFSHIICS